MVGNFMGDFVKGRVGEGYPPRVRDGILLHRRIDSFAQNHPMFRQSRQRLAPHYGLYRAVLVDLFYDHFLASEWEKWSAESLEGYLERVRKDVEVYLFCFPERLQNLVPHIFEKLLPSYLEIDGIGTALQRMARRVPRENPLQGGENELLKHYIELRSDFRCFLGDARDFVTRTLRGDIG